MITLRADNRALLKGAKFSYLNANYQSGVTSLVVANGTGFAANDYVLLGNFGSETSEIVQVSAVSTNTLTVGATLFAHSESTRVTILPYNQVKFYRTTTATFGTGSQLGSTLNIQADDYFTRYLDVTNTTGFGWFVFYNSTTAVTSTNSNAIPYANFGFDTVQRVLDMFWNELSNNELKLISEQEAFDWLNEAYKTARVELNLVNREYGASGETSIAVSAGTAEYLISTYATDFSDVITLWDGTDKVYIEPISIEDAPRWAANVGAPTRYYLRGSYIGFAPTPAESKTYTLVYSTMPTELTSYYDTVSLPDTGVYALRDYMLFRASTKVSRIDGRAHLDLFNSTLNRMKVTAHKRDGGKDQWSPAPETLV